jgi:hypothetical protein
MTINQPTQPQPPQQPAKSKLSGKVKLGIALAILLWLGSCGAIIGAIGGSDPVPAAAPSSAPPVTEPPAEETTTAPEPEPTEPAPEPEPEPEPKPDPVAELKAAITEELGDINREDVKRRVTIKAAAKTGKPIEVKFAINDNLTDNLRRIGTRADVVDILKAVDREADWKYSEVIVRGTFSMVDQLGNAEESQVVFARYSRKTVSKINFENFLSDNIWEIADARLIHPEFQ